MLFMKAFFPRLRQCTILGVFLALATFQTYSAAQNELTPQEKSEGWRLLFDGKTVNGWRGFKKPAPPTQGWVVEKGELKHIAKGGGGDIISNDEFDDFDLTFEWRVAPGA